MRPELCGKRLKQFLHLMKVQQKEVNEQAARIVEDAKSEAKAAAEQAKIDLEKSVQRQDECGGRER